MIIAATNHPELLDRAVFRRFDDVITYGLPSPEIARGILESHLSTFRQENVDWTQVLDAATGLSQADTARAADEAAKMAVLSGSNEIATPMLLSTLAQRKAVVR
jgi:SpoVK/Ycf46/Vps4 family AAA+-type ATPase